MSGAGRHTFNYDILRETTHRPWPMPATPWIMTQTWHHVLFAHWPVEVASMRRAVPAQLDLDLCDGTAWIGVVAFEISNMAPRGVPLPLAFPELNVRTYVTVRGKPGVYFFSLDAASALAVWGARTFFSLPYFRAHMHVQHAPDAQIRYVSNRIAGDASFDGSYAPYAPAAPPVPGTLDFFLTERYCLYTVNRRGQAASVDIHHPRWPLQRAWAEISENTMARAFALAAPTSPPLLHYAERQDVVNWSIRTATASR
jgi:uncharacterized protein YqjF (DUF2071 family)